MLPGAKTSGTALGVAGAAWLSDELTTVTKHGLGYAVDPVVLEQSITTLLTAAWSGLLGATGLIGGLIVQYYWRKAQARWGEEPDTGPVAPTREPVVGQPGQ